LKFSIIPRISFVPREGKFFDLFEESARNLVKTADLFAEMIDKWDDVPGRARQIKELEHEGDEITHRIVALLNSTFITPIDREDISHLTEHLDDVADCIEDAASCMALYDVKKPTQRARELAAIIVKISKEVSQAIPHIRNRKDLQGLPECCIEINRLENEADAVARSALAELFRDKIDIADVIKWREIYQYMEDATDRCEDVANVLEGIMIKRT
jgi:predicted phosphate transport protein (TIGR00153 family)